MQRRSVAVRHSARQAGGWRWLDRAARARARRRFGSAPVPRLEAGFQTTKVSEPKPKMASTGEGPWGRTRTWWALVRRIMVKDSTYWRAGFGVSAITNACDTTPSPPFAPVTAGGLRAKSASATRSRQ
jgi:hypothetical protein